MQIDKPFPMALRFLEKAERIDHARRFSMKHMLAACAGSILSLSVLTTPCIAQGSFKIEPVRSPADLPPALLGLLDPQGTRLLDPQGQPVCDVWWRKVIPAQLAAPKQPRVLYGTLAPGALLGVLFFPTENEDSRDQKLKPGFYTMRYAQIADDESQSSVNSYVDAALLSPAEADTRYDQTLKLDELLRLSRRASGTKQPAVMNLVPVSEMYKRSPAVVADDQGSCTLQVRVHTQAAPESAQSELRLAILLVTPAKEVGGS